MSPILNLKMDFQEYHILLKFLHLMVKNIF
nr:MAG TPA: hypothetical protein [Caudoviricetes sp.]